MSGRVTTILEIPDEVFSEKILGDGIAVIPENDDIYSPVNFHRQLLSRSKFQICRSC